MQAAVVNTHQAIAAWCGHMILDDRPIVVRYAVACITVVVASLLASLLPGRLDPSHFALYFLAVIVSAWYAGFGGGLVSTILSALALDYFFITPTYTLELDSHAFVRTTVFLVVAIVTNVLTTARRRAEAGLRQIQTELEDRVRERTAELAKINDTLREEISERQKIERELIRVQQQMGRVEQLATLGRMTATIAHDLGTPLNSVLGYTQLLTQEPLPERARRRLAIIETEIHRMGEIIQSYLSLTRGNPVRGKIIVNDLIRDTVVLLQPAFEPRGVSVTMDLAKTLPVIFGDGNSIQRMLVNLLDNALDASNTGGHVSIVTEESVGAKYQEPGVVISLSDTGEGISPEMLPKVFDLFVTSKAPGKGTGLGLVICQEIAKAHGGTIHITSQLGAGTTVKVFLPVNPRSEAAAASEEHDERTDINR